MAQFSGFENFILSDEEVIDYYSGKKEEILSNKVQIENYYYLVYNKNKELIDKLCYQNGQYRSVPFTPLGDNNFSEKIKPRNPEQIIAFDMLKDESSKIKVLTGKFGTGKTLALVTAALELVEKGKFDKIYWIRNNVQVKDTDPLGALPGDALDKMLPYVGPFMDHVGGIEGVRTLIEQDKLEVIPLGYIRGRSIRHSIIISSEAENLTKEQIQLLIGRVDEGSNLWIDGDLKQRDGMKFEKSAGLEKMLERLTGNKLFAHVHLEKTERSDVAALADLLD